MTFSWPMMLWLLLSVPLLIWLYLFLLGRRRKTAVRYANLTLVKEAMGKGPGFRRHLPPLLLLLGWTAAVFATARPAMMVTLPSNQNTVILAMDVSGSMRAADVEPNRIIAAQEAAAEFVASQPRQTRVGIVAFAGAAMLVQSPTTDREAVLEAIERFQLQRGTNLGGAIVASLRTLMPDARFEIEDRRRGDSPRAVPLGESSPDVEDDFVPVEPGSYTNASIVLMTDGQPTTGPDPVEAARLAADRGVRVFTVGFGSREGEIVGFGGRSMRVQLDEDMLRHIAEATRGRYFHAATGADLAEVYKELTSQFVMEREETEVTAIFSGLAALLMMLSATLSFVWFNRIM